MIRAYFGIDTNPFSTGDITLLPFQQDIYDILMVHSQQGGLCLLMGEPGTGKTAIKETLYANAGKRMKVITVARTLHTYITTVRILCEAFSIDFEGSHFKCEKRLIEEAFNLNRTGIALVTIIDDAHLMEMENLRRLRLLFEDFPKNHNVILIGQPGLLYKLSLKVNDDIKSRITYSVCMTRLNPDQMEQFILNELDKAGLGHNVFSQEALALVVRSSEGILRRARNLSLSCLLEAVRARRKQVNLENVNKVLIQPHWRNEQDIQEALGS